MQGLHNAVASSRLFDRALNWFAQIWAWAPENALVAIAPHHSYQSSRMSPVTSQITWSIRRRDTTHPCHKSWQDLTYFVAQGYLDDGSNILGLTVNVLGSILLSHTLAEMATAAGCKCSRPLKITCRHTWDCEEQIERYNTDICKFANLF